MAIGAPAGHRSPRGNHQSLEIEMNTIRNLGAMALVAVLTLGNASAHDGRDGGNRILGLWESDALVGICVNGVPQAPLNPIRNTLLFHAGGTVVENPRGAPSGTPNVAGIPGIYQRNQALGTWAYDHRTRTYYLHLRFDNFVDGVWDGWSTVDREMVLTQRGMFATGPVTSTRFRANGMVHNVVCGNANGKPL